ncbi:hypothetical protein NDU88_000974 [Pleurodeles waltl]|uniref:Uncharacterized protein n=1 Tax=Pleurodeles waltl TaxID=8319 RepID=A0AAV7U805_PLEWA|nr:hypothetical protein NDU88_000974 [Pleurodeles waltl]
MNEAYRDKGLVRQMSLIERDGESANRSPAVPGSSGCYYGCFGNRFRPRPPSRGSGLAGCQQARAVSVKGERQPAEERVAAPWL